MTNRNKKFIILFGMFLWTILIKGEEKIKLKAIIDKHENKLLINISRADEIQKKRLFRIKKLEYIVKPGDSLARIAIKYKTTTKKIMNNNNIKNINLIYPGQKLIIG